MRYMGLLLVGVVSLSSYGVQQPSFYQFVKQLKYDAVAQDISAPTIAQSLGQVKLFKRAIHHHKVNHNARQTLETFLPAQVPDWKISKARELFKQHRPLLNKIYARYGVQPRFIIAIWGIETGFSQKLSSYPAMSVLVSLAFSEPDNNNYRQQIFAALRLLDNNADHRADFRSDWSGKLGVLNFTVANYLANGQDFDQDGFVDIWQSKADAFASVAKFLADSGWNKDLTWGRQVKLPAKFDPQYLGIEQSKTLAQWQKLGVRRFNGNNLPTVNLKAAIVAPDGIDGRVYLAYSNYNVLLDWQDSPYFVSAVGYLADRIKYPPIK